MPLNCHVEGSWKSLELWNQTLDQILKEIIPEYSLEGLMLKLKLQYFGPLRHRTDSWHRERLKAGGKGTTEDEMVECHHRLDGHKFKQVLGVGEGQASFACCSPWGQRVKSLTWLSDWTELNVYNVNIYLHFSDHWLERGSFHLYTGHLFFSKLPYLPPSPFFLSGYLFHSL